MARLIRTNISFDMLRLPWHYGCSAETIVELDDLINLIVIAKPNIISKAKQTKGKFPTYHYGDLEVDA